MGSKRSSRRQGGAKANRRSTSPKSATATASPRRSAATIDQRPFLPLPRIEIPASWRTHWQRLRARVATLLPADSALRVWLGRLFGPDAPTWLVVLLVAPILAIGFLLTTGWLHQGMPWNWTIRALPWIDNDYWWHLGTGNWILDHQRVPRDDPFSWTYSGREWVAHEWLAEVILALTVRASGYGGAIVLTAVIAVVGFWWLLSAGRTYGLSWRTCLLLTLLWGGVFVRSGVIVVRPQLWTFSLLALLLWQIAGYETGRRRTLWLLPPLFIIWVNLNLTALVGIACLGAFGVDRLVRRKLDRHLVTIGVLSLLALLVNPTGPFLMSAILKYRGQNEIWHDRIFEWMSPDLSDRTHLGFVLALPIVPFAVWQLLKLRIWPAAPLLLLCYQSFGAVRFIPLFVMLAFVFAGWLVWHWNGERAGRVIGVFALDYRRPWTFAPAALAVVLVLVVAIRSDRSQFRENPIAFGYPVVATDILLEQYPETRIFNVYDYGGYLIYRFEGDPGVYVDGRGEMYSNDFLRHYFDLIGGGTGWEEALVQEGVNAVLVRHIDGLSLRLREDPDWQEVYSDNYSILYVHAPQPEDEGPVGGSIGD